MGGSLFSDGPSLCPVDTKLASKNLVPIKEAKTVLHGLKGKKVPRKATPGEKYLKPEIL